MLPYKYVMQQWSLQYETAAAATATASLHMHRITSPNVTFLLHILPARCNAVVKLLAYALSFWASNCNNFPFLFAPRHLQWVECNITANFSCSKCQFRCFLLLLFLFWQLLLLYSLDIYGCKFTTTPNFVTLKYSLVCSFVRSYHISE